MSSLSLSLSRNCATDRVARKTQSSVEFGWNGTSIREQRRCPAVRISTAIGQFSFSVRIHTVRIALVALFLIFSVEDCLVQKTHSGDKLRMEEHICTNGRRNCDSPKEATCFVVATVTRMHGICGVVVCGVVLRCVCVCVFACVFVEDCGGSGGGMVGWWWCGLERREGRRREK